MTLNLICKIFNHNLGDWEYLDSSSCWQLLKCKRCSYFEKRLHHIYESWQYKNDDTRYRKCARCRQKFVEEKSICTVCNGSGSYTTTYTDSNEVTCSGCGGSGMELYPISSNKPCGYCGGTGKMSLSETRTATVSCPTCGGKGFIWKSKS